MPRALFQTDGSVARLRRQGAPPSDSPHLLFHFIFPVYTPSYYLFHLAIVVLPSSSLHFVAFCIPHTVRCLIPLVQPLTLLLKDGDKSEVAKSNCSTKAQQTQLR